VIRVVPSSNHRISRNGIDLECARDFAVAQLFAASRPNGVVSLTLFRNHYR
jgi:hypothetical protein